MDAVRRGRQTLSMSRSDLHTHSHADIQPGDWIKYRSEYYGSGRLAEVHGVGTDLHSGDYAVTTEGNVLFDRILEVRRRPINVVVLDALR
jgi:hypothetical protein